MKKNFTYTNKILTIILVLSVLFSAVPMSMALAAGGTSSGKILILAPHPDDEALMAAGIMEKGITDGKTVKVVLATNGDYAAAPGNMTVGQTRIRESLAACTYLGVPSSNLIPMGYGDSTLPDLFGATDPNAVIASNEGTATYGTPENPDYHYQKYGTHATYTRNNFKSDLQTLINDYRPDDIYVTSRYDAHSDHNTLNSFTLEVLRQLKRNDSSYSPKLHETLIHTNDGETNWPVHVDTTSTAPLLTFSKPTTFDASCPLDWTARESVSVPTDMTIVPMSAGSNMKYNAISKYSTQLYDPGYMYGFVKSDEFFWVKDFSNIAPLATVTASSEITSTGQTAIKAVDGIIDGYPRAAVNEWAVVGQTAGAWINLAWSGSQNITSVKLYDRPNTTENITSGTLTFSDGSSISVSALPNNGFAQTITFPQKTVTWVKFTVNTATGTNVGLSEFEVYGQAAATDTQYYTIKDRWTNNYLYDNGAGKVNYGDAASSDYYKWSIETSGGYTQIRNKATGNYMSVENQLGYVESTVVGSGWYSKDWTFTDLGTGYKQIVNRWLTPQGINVENQKGYAEYGTIGSGMWSAQFIFTATN